MGEGFGYRMVNDAEYFPFTSGDSARDQVSLLSPSPPSSSSPATAAPSSTKWGVSPSVESSPLGRKSSPNVVLAGAEREKKAEVESEIQRKGEGEAETKSGFVIRAVSLSEEDMSSLSPSNGAITSTTSSTASTSSLDSRRKNDRAYRQTVKVEKGETLKNGRSNDNTTTTTRIACADNGSELSPSPPPSPPSSPPTTRHAMSALGTPVRSESCHTEIERGAQNSPPSFPVAVPSPSPTGVSKSEALSFPPTRARRDATARNPAPIPVQVVHE